MRKWIKSYKKRWGLFGLLFPIAMLLCGGGAVLWALGASGFDVIGWMCGPRAIVLYALVAIALLEIVSLWCAF